MLLAWQTRTVNWSSDLPWSSVGVVRVSYSYGGRCFAEVVAMVTEPSVYLLPCRGVCVWEGGRMLQWTVAREWWMESGERERRAKNKHSHHGLAGPSRHTAPDKEARSIL